MGKDPCIKLHLSHDSDILETPSVMFSSSVTASALCVTPLCQAGAVCPSFFLVGVGPGLESGAAGCH